MVFIRLKAWSFSGKDKKRFRVENFLGGKNFSLLVAQVTALSPTNVCYVYSHFIPWGMSNLYCIKQFCKAKYVLHRFRKWRLFLQLLKIVRHFLVAALVFGKNLT